MKKVPRYLFQYLECRGIPKFGKIHLNLTLRDLVMRTKGIIILVLTYLLVTDQETALVFIALFFLRSNCNLRIVLGMRFGLLQTKIGLVHLLKNYKFYPTPNTKVPLKFDQESGVLISLNDIYFRVEKLQ